MTTVLESIPRVGDDAPVFELSSSGGRKTKLSDFKGKPVVLYFYPKDDTPGCTVEAQGFQARLKDFQKAGVEVVGISPDDCDSHCKFAEKYGLGFTLLCDTEHEVAEKYGAWVEKNMYGKKKWGIRRSTFLIDRSGKLAKAWPDVKPEGHADEVLEAAREL